MKKIILISFLIIALIVIAIFAFEISSRIYKCKEYYPRVYCHFLVLPATIEENKKLISDLKERRLTGEKIFKKEYYQAAEKLVLEVSPNALEGYLNGISCGNIGYVRNDLPGEAKKFVKRHELEHLLQTGKGIDKEKNREFSANLAAGKEYPVGAIQTIVFSILNRVKFYDSPICYILSLWKTFKIYFLP